MFYFARDGNIWFDIIYGIYFINDSIGFGCGRQNNDSLPSGNYHDIIYKTSDGGHNWNLIHKEYVYPQIGFYNNISFADEKNGITVGFYGKIAMTNDGGETWVYEEFPNDMKNCRKMQVCWAGRTPLIGTWDAGIFRYEGNFFKFPEDTTGVEDNLITNDQLLITPNPAGDFIEIRYGFLNHRVNPMDQELEIEIYNVLGLCVKTVPIPPMTASQRMNIEDLTQGVYFVKIGNLVQLFVKE